MYLPPHPGNSLIYVQGMKNIHNEILVFSIEQHERDKSFKQKDFHCSINHNN